LTLVQTQKVTRFPVILYGTQYWSGLIEWLRNTVLPGGKINPADLELVHLVDDVDEAVAIIVDAEKARSAQDEVERAVAAEGPQSRIHDGQ
jgi:predicted Rossmann-fold nucleotide-binding protein